MSGPAATNPWLPLTSAQRGLFFAHERDPESPAYTTAEVVEIDGALDADRLAAAIQAAYADFEQLRTRFRIGPAGPEQQVLERSAIRLEIHDAEDAEEAGRWIAEALRHPLDLVAGEVTRTALLRVGATTWWFHAAHHLVLDGFGYLQFARRVAAHYRGDATALPTAGVADVVAEDLARPDDGDFWTDRLAAMTGSSTLAGATADPAPAALRHVIEIDQSTQTALIEAATRDGTRWTDVVTAAFGAYLARLSPDPGAQARIGVPLMNRIAPGREAPARTRTVCTAMNVLPVPVTADGTVGETIARVRREVAAIGAHSRTRQEDLARMLRRLGEAGLFGPQVNLLPFDPVLDFGSASGTVRNLTAGPVEDMTWCVRGSMGRGRPVRLEVDANPRLYDPAETVRHAERLGTWLGTFANASLEQAVSDLPILTESERRLVVEEFNATDRERSTRTLAEAFADQAAATPDAVALRWQGRDLTYAELSAEADRVAAALAEPAQVVGVALPRGPELFAAVHGIGRAGAAYAPLDLDLPAARLADMIADAGIDTVITTADAGRLLPGQVRCLLIEGLPTPTAPISASLPGPDDPAYVLFTSGSTGRPKGVVVSHRAIDNRLAWMQDRFALTAGDRVLHKTPVSFDVSVWELFWPLQVGATVVIAEPGGHRDPRYLAELMATENVDVVHFVPSMLRAFVDDPRAVDLLPRDSLRHLVCSGEALPAELVRDTVDALGTAPVNLYGPTEAAVDVTAWSCDPHLDGPEVPIGRPIWNTRAYVLDAERAPVPIGVTGELYLAGVQLADGYIGRDDLTAAAFLPDPFVTGQRMYRTGDLARWRADGALLYRGRADGQVKIRGQRVELGEIERVLGGVGSIASVTAVARPSHRGDLELVAFYVPRTPGRDCADELRAAALAYLTSAMVPSRFVLLDAVPLGTSGKTDRRALAALPLPDRPPHSAEAPAGFLEEDICELMGDVLGTSLAPVEDFFASGGTSMLALRVIAGLEYLTGNDVRFADLFAAPTPRRLAARIAAEATGADDLATILTLRPGSGDRAPIFALPPAGGLGWCYTGLLRHLPVDQGLYAVQAAGMDGSEVDPPASLEDWGRAMVADIRSVTTGPFHLVGWSIGGMAAHTVATLAKARGQEVGVVMMLDAYPSDQWQHLDEPDETEALRGVLRMGRAEHLVPADADLDLTSTVATLRNAGSAVAALPTPVLEASIRSVVTCARLVRGARHDQLDHDVHLVVAGAPRSEHWLDATAWEPYVRGQIAVHTLDATHPELVRQPHIGAIGDRLAEAVAAWR